MTRFRPQRGSLSSAMKSLFIFDGIDELRTHLSLDPRDALSIERYSDVPDTRIGWAVTMIVLVRRHDSQSAIAVGFVDGPCSGLTPWS